MIGNRKLSFSGGLDGFDYESRLEEHLDGNYFWNEFNLFICTYMVIVISICTS